MIGEYERDVDVEKIQEGDEVEYEENGKQSGIVVKAVVKDNYSRFHVHHKNDDEEIKILPGHSITGHKSQRATCKAESCDGELVGYPTPLSERLACTECGKEFNREEVQ